MALTLSSTSVVPAHDEPDLVAATRGGDERAFEELYSIYRERIFAFILSRVHDVGRAEDIAQDVFISALRRLRAGDKEIAFKPWIYEIAKNACIDEFRRGTRSREVLLESDSEPPSGWPTTLSALPTPVAAVESKLRMTDLRGAFGGLSETHHQLLVLREFEGLSYDEIGERLDMTRQMVESGLFRARRKLAEEYQDLASGRRCAQVQSAIEVGAMASARTLGIRERRRFARHLSHCQACRRVALQAGVDDTLVRPRSVAARIAAFLPLPFPLWHWLCARGSAGGAGAGVRAASAGVRAASGGGSHHLVSASLQNTSGLAEPAAGSAVTVGPAAVTAAALAIAGAGGGLLHHVIAPGHSTRPVVAAPAAGAASTHRRVAPSAATPLAATAIEPGPAMRHAAGALRAGHPSLNLRRTSTTTAAAPRSHRPSSGTPSAKPAGNAPTRAGTSAPPPGGSAASGTAGTVRAATEAPRSASAPVTRVASTVGSTLGSTVQHVGSTTTRGVTDAGSTLSKVTNTVTTTGARTIQGAVNTGQGPAGSPPAPASSSGQPAGSSPSSTTAVSGVTKPVNQAVGQGVQAVGQVTGGGLP
ncbi:MAG TPA: sigma-70 family RNA polymerase sigma factor [Solirubrobacteraceae bacterium]|nr:sigma-70 family RNA polymerase sigma factor [Solirubrobacteraceae bacterium]